MCIYTHTLSPSLPLKPQPCPLDLNLPPNILMQGISTTVSSFSHSHRRRDSGEIDVFAATQYFSNEVLYDSRRTTRVERKSLDMPMEAKIPQPQEMTRMMNHHIKEKTKLKQPSSPSGKLVSFVNSLFQQYYSSKKKKPTKPLKSATTTHDSDTKRSGSMSNDYYYKSCYHSSSCKKRDDGVCGDEFYKLKISAKKEGTIKEKVEDVDDGESDSSSDLFELKNYDFVHNSVSRNHELPVKGTTSMGVIRGGASTVAY